MIDIPKGFLDEAYWGGNRNNRNAEQVSGDILKEWRILDLPIFHIGHSSSDPESNLHKTNPGFGFNDFVLPKLEEPILIKNVNCAFTGTNLQERLDGQNINTLVIIDLTTNHCVSTTTRIAANLGYKTI